MRTGARLRRWGPPVLLFATALLLRLWLFSGFVLCDDAEELQLVERILDEGADFRGHLQYRVPLWLPSVLAMRVLGRTEAGFFLPTVLLSASLPVLGFAILRRCGRSRGASFAAAAVVATAPFEVLLGGLRANDVVLEWLVAAGLLALVHWRAQPRRQGASVAVIFFLAFATKLWAVYFLPALFLGWVGPGARHGGRRAAAVFTVLSAGLHGLAAVFWKLKIGVFLPFLAAHSATYAIEPERLSWLWLEYPRQVFVGAAVGSTLFGLVPYVVLAFTVLAARRGLARVRSSWGTLDALLAATWATFFLLLELFPNSFQFDRYYSAPRIFRYLAPLSFPLALHAGKLIAEMRAARSVRVLAIAGMLAVNVVQALEATEPGRAYRAALLGVAYHLRLTCPPVVLADTWPTFFLRRIYLRGTCPRTEFVNPIGVQAATAYEAWLAKNGRAIPEGTVLVSGLASCVHFSCVTCGYRLAQFERPLARRFALVRDFGALDFYPTPEPVRLWRAGPPESAPGTRPTGAATLQAEGMAAFDAGRYAVAQHAFETVLADHRASPEAVDAAYFEAVCHWRMGEPLPTLRRFEWMLREFPDGRWTVAGFYHLGLAHEALGQFEEARSYYARVVSARDVGLGPHAAARLRELPGGLPLQLP